MKHVKLLLPMMLFLISPLLYAEQTTLIPNGTAQAPMAAEAIQTDTQAINARQAEKTSLISNKQSLIIKKSSNDSAQKSRLALPHSNNAAQQTKTQDKDIPSSLLMMLAFAFLGGMILNLMPCVLPILSLKILNLKNSKNKIAETMSYALGVLVSFIALAVFVIVVKATGSSVGWGFQMQSPPFIIFLIFLFSLITVNLLDFFDIPFSLNINLRRRSTDPDKLLFSFLTGVLAVMVTTPCSAPFMATAIGFTLTASNIDVLMIFISLGIGFSFPYLIVGFFPALIAFIPRPGAWMMKFKEFLCFPMVLTVIWLFWVLSGLTGSNGQALVMLSLTALFFTMWLRASIKNKWLRYPFIIIGLAMTIIPLQSINQHLSKMEQAPSAQASVTYNQDTLNGLIKQKKKVFVYVTASWCITCKVNEKMALNTEKVKNFFKDNDIIIMKADWTKKSNYILDFLKSFNRAGLPLYVYYPPGKEPVVLPQILTPAAVIDPIKNAL